MTLGGRIGRLLKGGATKSGKCIVTNVKEFSQEVGLTSAVRCGIRAFGEWTHKDDEKSTSGL